VEHKNQTKRPSCFRLTPFFAKLFLLIAVLAFLSGCENKHTCDKESRFLEFMGMKKNGNINETIRVNYLNGNEVPLYANEVMDIEVLLQDYHSPIQFDSIESLRFYHFNQNTCEWLAIDNEIVSLQSVFDVEPHPRHPTVMAEIMIISSKFVPEPKEFRIASKGYLLDKDHDRTKPLLGFFDVVILPER